MLKSIKTLTGDSGEFSETVKYQVLFCANTSGNNNKFYCLEIQKNKNNYYRLFANYGRLGISEVFDIKVKKDDNLITDLNEAEQEFAKIIKDKLRGKTVKDEKTGQSWRENYEEVDTFAPTVGSSNIRGKSNVVVKTSKAAVDTSSITNTKIVKIINQIVDENIHSITHATALTLTSNGFETPLGPVTKEHVQKARTALDNLKSMMKNDKLNNESTQVKSSNNLYYSLIPHDFGRKIQESDWILDVGKLTQEYDLLDQLESAVTMGSSLNATASQKLNALSIDFDELDDRKECQRLTDYVHNSKAGNHRGADVWNWKVGNIFKVRIPNERSRFETTGLKLGNVKELFHGSKNCNILSILMNGLIIPPCNCPTFSGRMFGNGIYGAHHSTKSLNYSTGFWGGSVRNKCTNSFLFIVKFAMGKYHIAKSSMSNVPSGCDSIWAQSGGGLYNDEYIVFKLHQATITHLIEMVK